MKIKFLILIGMIAISSLWSSQLNAQVTGVSYQARYNAETCMYDFYIIINEGSATSIPHRAQFNAQYTVIVPTGSTIVGQPINHMPLQNNQNYTGTTPLKWVKSAFVSDPGAAPGLDFQSIVPTLSPAAFYNDLATGDSIKIFSLDIDPVVNCGSEVRIFDNNSDPGSSAEGMEGGDFSNGFTLGGSTQIYDDNLENVDPPLPDVSSVVDCSDGISIDLTATVSLCQTPATYEWEGPASFSSTEEDVSISPASSANNGTYTVTVTDGIGCTQVHSVDVFVPDAGADQDACAGAIVNLQGTPNTGTWSADAGNPPGAGISSGPNGSATVTLANSANGDYTFIYDTGGCTDELIVSVSSSDAGQDPSAVTCFEFGSATLNATGSGTWSLAVPAPGTVTITDPSSPQTDVTDFSAAGNYNLVWTVGLCTDTTTIVVGDDCNCTIQNNTITPPGVTDYCGSPGAISIDGSTATPSGTYLWELDLNGGGFTAAPGLNDQEDYTTEPLTAGDYSFRRVYTTDVAPICSDISNMVMITVTDQPIPPANLTAIPNPLCLGETTDLSADNVQGAIYTWSASAPEAGLGVSSSNLNTATPTMAGTYTITVIQTIDGCDSDPSTVDIVVGETPPTPDPGDYSSTNPTACGANDGTISIANLPPNTTYTLEYEFNGSATSSTIMTDGAGTATLSNLMPGTYTNFVIVSADDCDSGVFSGPLILSDPNPPPAPANITAVPNPACVGEDILVTVDENQGATFNWTVDSPNAQLSNSTTNTVTVTASQAGFYTVQVTQTIDGCTSTTNSITVQFLASPPTPTNGTTIGVDPSSCGASDGSIEISGYDNNATYEVIYSFNGMPDTVTIAANGVGTIVIPNLSEGTYTNFSVGTPGGCTSGVFPGPISLIDPGAPNPPPGLTAVPNPACLGETINLSVGDNQNATFMWSASAPEAGIVASATNTTTMTPTQAGTYTVFVSQSIGGCTSGASMIEVTVFEVPPTPDGTTVMSTNPSACGASDGSITISELVNGQSYDVTYSVNGIPTTMTLIANGMGMIVIPNLSAGSYTDFSLSTAGGCSSGVYDGPVALVDPNAPNAPTGLAAQPNPVCFTGTVNLSVDNVNGATFFWSADSPNAGLVPSSTNTTTMTASTPGTYTISVTMTIAGCESPAATIDVEVLPAPDTPTLGDFSSTDPSGCGVSDGTITINGLVSGQTYIIDYTFNGNPASITLVANGNGSVTILNLPTGAYSNFQLENGDGCESGVFTGVITLNDPSQPNPPSNLMANPNPACLGSIVDLSVVSNNAATFTWTVSPSQNAGLAAGNMHLATLTPTEGGIYTVSVTQTIGGCTSPPTSIEVFVEENCLNPDFGVTWNDYTLPGNLSTNDNQQSGSTYGPAIALGSNPSACMPVILPNGIYTFDCSVTGEYNYVVEVCRPNQSANCTPVPLTITVLLIEGTDNPPVGNHDYIATTANNDVFIEVLDNDRCQSSPSCNLLNETIAVQPTNGSYNPITNSYTPNPGFVGQDVMIYEVCQNPATSENCDLEAVYINVYPASATGFTNGMGDYGQTSLNTPLTKSAADGVLSNDTDPLDIDQTVTGHTATVPGAGSVVINSDGSYVFTPANGYIGPVDFPYEVCRLSTNMCDNATLHILVEPMAPTGTITSCVWLDDNGNGMFQNGEAGIEGVIVNMYNLQDQLVGTTTTNSAGTYTFIDVLAGFYYFEFIAPDIYELTFPNIGNEANDSDVDGSNGENTTASFELEPGEILSDVKAGYYECVEIGDNVWYDFNKNDIYDSGENGINGIIVNLWRIEGGQTFIQESTTAGGDPDTPSGDGHYEFCAPPGTYFVEVVMPPQGLVQALPFRGNDPYKDSDLNNASGPGTTSPFTLGSGEAKLDIGAGFYPMAMAGNLVWEDENNDGIQNPDEARVAGVTVQAIDANTQVVLSETVTDENGIYNLKYLDKRDIYFKFTPPDGFSATVADIGFDNIDSDVDHSFGLNTTRKFNMVPEELNENIDFGISSGALPVTWLGVKVSADKEGHLIEWEVEQEINVDYYQIERSIDSRSNWEDLKADRINANNVVSVSSYESRDASISQTGKYYYRIKQYDFDGKFSHSKVVSIEANPKLDAKIYPNPSSGLINVSYALDLESQVHISVVDNLGRRVFETSTIKEEGAYVQELDLSKLENGAYNMTIKIGNESTMRRVILIK